MKKITVLSVVILLSFLMPPAFAHSELVSSNPGTSANIQQLPEQIELEFNEELLNLGTGNSISIMSPSGEDLGMEDAYCSNEFFDSRNKGEDASLQVGVPDEEWTKTGGFQPLAYGDNEY